MPRFVLLRHETPVGSPRPSHWDFMVERDGALATWSLAELPAAWQVRLGLAAPPSGAAPEAEACPATRLPDHRLAYLDFEGPVSGNRGTVARCDAGDAVWGEYSPARCVLAINGARLQDAVTLARASEAQSWVLSVSPRS